MLIIWSEVAEAALEEGSQPSRAFDRPEYLVAAGGRLTSRSAPDGYTWIEIQP